MVLAVRLVRRIARRATQIAACVALLCASAHVSTAQDVQTARHDLAQADDFRLRVQAALFLGKSKSSNARDALERGLGDPHPAVRTAAAAALRTLGDPAAIPALQRHLASEGSGAVKSQIQTTIATLQGGGSGSSNAGATRYAVQLGAMRNLTNVRGEQLSQVMRSAAQRQAAAIPGAVLSPTGSAAAPGVPTLVLDGSIVRLSQRAEGNGQVAFSAQVEFSVRKVPEHTLRAALSGAATSIGTARSLNTPARVSELQDQAVSGAVESAMQHADTGFVAVLKNQ